MSFRAQAIIIREGKILFGFGCLNIAEKRFGHYFIGGAVEEGESCEEAACRELLEEANVKGSIVFRFSREVFKNAATFLMDIGDESPALGYDPEEDDFPKEMKTLQELIWVPLDNYHYFTDIDLKYMNRLAYECEKNNYYPMWYGDVLDLISAKK